MKNVLLAVLVLFLPLFVSAESLESRYMEKISRARSPAEVTRLTKAYSDLKEARTACRIQLRRKTLPSACYDSLKGEIQLGMHASSGEKKRLMEKLDEKCAETASTIYLQGEAAPRISGISAFCARKVSEARRIQAYRDDNRGNWSEN